MSTDDLASLFPALSQFEDLGFHMGQIIAWDPQTGSNKVRVLGVVLDDLPTLNLTETLTMTTGSLVALLRSKSTLFILGRVTKPNTPQFFSGAMPATTTAFYQINTDGPLQTATVGGGYTVKTKALHVIHHRYVVFGVNVDLSGAGASPVGAYKVQWFTESPDNAPDPPGGTTMAEGTGFTTGTNNTHHVYEWPAGMRGRSVHVAYLVALTSGTAGAWASAMPNYFYGSNTPD